MVKSVRDWEEAKRNLEKDYTGVEGRKNQTPDKSSLYTMLSFLANNTFWSVSKTSGQLYPPPRILIHRESGRGRSRHAEGGKDSAVRRLWG